MSIYKVLPPAHNKVNGTVVLNGSKSIANRALIIRALTNEPFEISNLSNADDTTILDDLLKSDDDVLDAGAGGTTFRFLTAYLATQAGREVVLTGSERMQQRPIRLLVNALNTLGADISYEKHEGFPPLRIKGRKLKGGKVSIPADTSSQYISALLMIGPTLSEGLELQLEGEIVSLPYILMTLNLMRYFGAECSMEGNTICVKESPYQARPFFVEADWSAASYFYSIVMLADEADIQLEGLSEDSIQGDAVIARLLAPWVHTEYGQHTVRLTKTSAADINTFRYDFLECPDLGQTVVAALAAKKIDAELSGLKTLLIKETDRVAALDNELRPYGVTFSGSVDANLWKLSARQFNPAPAQIPAIQTYEDHRMAMSFAPLALVTGEMHIDEPNVVTKSYPAYWNDLRLLGFEVSEL